MLRRSMLGLAAGGALAVGRESASSATPPAPPPTVSNNGNMGYVVPSGDTNGGSDAYAINYALQRYATVVLLPGEFYINAPIQFSPYTSPPGTTINYGGQLLTGTCGATQAGAGTPGMNTKITATASFISPVMAHVGAGQANPAGMIMCGVVADSGGAEHPLIRCEIRDLWLDGNNRNLDCITVWSINSGFAVRRVGCANGLYGLNVRNVSDLTGNPIGMLAEDVVVMSCNTGGVYANATDIGMKNVHAQNNGIPNTGNCPGITIMTGNARLISCRADLNSGYGFVLNAHNGANDIGVGVTMIGCGTQQNLLGAAYVVSNEADFTFGPVQMTGCWFEGDGSYLGGSSGGSGYNAAVLAQGRVAVSMTDVVISTAGSTTPVYPAYCVQTMAGSTDSSAVPDLITVMGGMWEAGIQYVLETNRATHAQLTGTVGFIGTVSASTGTTPYTLVPSTVFGNHLN